MRDCSRAMAGPAALAIHCLWAAKGDAGSAGGPSSEPGVASGVTSAKLAVAGDTGRGAQRVWVVAICRSRRRRARVHLGEWTPRTARGASPKAGWAFGPGPTPQQAGLPSSEFACELSAENQLRTLGPSGSPYSSGSSTAAGALAGTAGSMSGRLGRRGDGECQRPPWSKSGPRPRSRVSKTGGNYRCSRKRPLSAPTGKQVPHSPSRGPEGRTDTPELNASVCDRT